MPAIQTSGKTHDTLSSNWIESVVAGSCFSCCHCGFVEELRLDIWSGYENMLCVVSLYCQAYGWGSSSTLRFAKEYLVRRLSPWDTGISPENLAIKLQITTARVWRFQAACKPFNNRTRIRANDSQWFHTTPTAGCALGQYLKNWFRKNRRTTPACRVFCGSILPPLRFFFLCVLSLRSIHHVRNLPYAGLVISDGSGISGVIVLLPLKPWVLRHGEHFTPMQAWSRGIIQTHSQGADELEMRKGVWMTAVLALWYRSSNIASWAFWYWVNSTLATQALEAWQDTCSSWL